MKKEILELLKKIEGIEGIDSPCLVVFGDGTGILQYITKSMDEILLFEFYDQEEMETKLKNYIKENK